MKCFNCNKEMKANEKRTFDYCEECKDDLLKRIMFEREAW